MNINWKHIAFSVLLGFIIGLIIATDFRCGPNIQVPHNGAALRSPSVQIETIYDTAYRDRIIYRDRWHVREVPAVVEIDSTRTPETSPAYVARIDTVTPYADTVRATFRHPERTFSLDIRPRPDTIRNFFVTETRTTVIRDHRKWGIGFHAGPGLQMARDGVVRAGVNVGVGINFNLWEP